MNSPIGGARARPVVADAGYGDNALFRLGLTAAAIPYVVAVKASTSAYPADAFPDSPPLRPAGAGPRRPATGQDRHLAKLALSPPGAGRLRRSPGATAPGPTGQPDRGHEIPLPRPAVGPPTAHRPAATTEPCPRPGCSPNGRRRREPTDYWLSNLPADTRLARTGPAGENPLAHRTRLPRTQNRPRPGPLRGPLLARLAPPRHPRHRRPPLHHQATPRTQKPLGQPEPVRGPQGTPTDPHLTARHAAPTANTPPNLTKYY